MRTSSIFKTGVHEKAAGGIPGAFAIDRPRQLAALASPMRQELLDALVASGASSVAELAAHLGRPADSLYFHLRHLKRVGLVLEVERRKNGRQVAVVYDVPGRPMRIAQGVAPARAMDAVISSVLRLAQRDYRRGLKDPAARVEGDRRDLWGGRIKGWIAEEDLPRINGLIEELQAVIRRGRPGPDRRGIALAFVLAPVRTGTRRNGTVSSEEKPAAKSVTKSAKSAANKSAKGLANKTGSKRPQEGTGS